jgi:predicted lipoprotein with Yx(FWY)xxD motif
MEPIQGHRASTRRACIGRLAALAVTAAALTGTLAAAAFTPTIAVAATTSTTATVISTAKNDKLGTILVSGNTVYTVKASKTACTTQCAKTWTAVVLPSGVSTATAGTGVDASKLGTKSTADGSLQITYDGKPLYWSTKDKAPGQVHGASDKWGKWAAVVTAAAKSGTGDTSPGTGGAAF